MIIHDIFNAAIPILKQKAIDAGLIDDQIGQDIIYHVAKDDGEGNWQATESDLKNTGSFLIFLADAEGKANHEFARDAKYSCIVFVLLSSEFDDLDDNRPSYTTQCEILGWLLVDSLNEVELVDLAFDYVKNSKYNEVKNAFSHNMDGVRVTFDVPTRQTKICLSPQK